MKDLNWDHSRSRILGSVTKVKEVGDGIEFTIERVVRVSESSEKVELTKEETDVLLAIAKRTAIDRDGDILRFFIKEDEDIVQLLWR